MEGSSIIFKQEPQVNDERFASWASLEARQVYRWLEDEEMLTRNETRIQHPRAVDLWQESLRLRISPFLPGKTVNRQGSHSFTEFADAFSLEFRLLLLTTSVPSSKYVLDGVLSGLYTQAFVLQRNLLETWKRCLYTRKVPEDSFRWFPEDWIPEGIRTDSAFQGAMKGSPGALEWKELENRLTNSDDARLLGAANKMAQYLNSHTHPNLEGTTQHFLNAERYSMSVSPSYSSIHCLRALRYGLTLELLLLRETAHIPGLPDSWRKEAEELINDHIGPEMRSLAQRANVLEKENVESISESSNDGLDEGRAE